MRSDVGTTDGIFLRDLSACGLPRLTINRGAAESAEGKPVVLTSLMRHDGIRGVDEAQPLTIGTGRTCATATCIGSQIKGRGHLQG
jgi:hypothetical protein